MRVLETSACAQAVEKLTQVCRADTCGIWHRRGTARMLLRSMRPAPRRPAYQRLVGNLDPRILINFVLLTMCVHEHHVTRVSGSLFQRC